MIEQAKRQGPKEPTHRQWWLARNRDQLNSLQLYNFSPRGGGEGWYSNCARSGLSVDGRRLTEDERHSALMSYWEAPDWKDELDWAEMPVNSPYAVFRVDERWIVRV